MERLEPAMVGISTICAVARDDLHSAAFNRGPRRYFDDLREARRASEYRESGMKHGVEQRGQDGECERFCY
jgi:hypothetical protein